MVSLTPKVFEILLLLVENSGRVVRKAEILERVWPGVSVEDGSIAQNISILRKALDPAFDGSSPIATVARVGYRFTAPVRLNDPKTEDAAAAAESLITAAAPAAAEISAAAAQSAPVISERRRSLMLVTASVICLGLALSGFALWRLRVSSAGPRRSVAVLPFANLTGRQESAWLSTALTETLAGELGAGEKLRIITGESVIRSVKDFGIQPGSLRNDQLQDLHRNLGCDLVLTGSYLEAGGKVRLDLNLADASTGQPISLVSDSDLDQNLIDLVSKTGIEMRTKLGLGSPSSTQAEAVRASVSMDAQAARAYFEGLAALRLRDTRTATQDLEQAIAADPVFSLAHSALSTVKSLAGEDASAIEEAKKALDNSAHLPREDRLLIEERYYEALYNWSKAIEISRALLALDPDNPEYGLALGNAQYSAGRANELAQTIANLHKLAPPMRDDPRIDLLEASEAQMRGDYKRDKAAAQRALSTALAWKSKSLEEKAVSKVGTAEVQLAEFDAALSDFRRVQQLATELGDREGIVDSMRLQSSALLLQHHYPEAEKEFNATLAMGREFGYLRVVGRTLVTLADLYRAEGNLKAADDVLREAFTIAQARHDHTVEISAGIALGIVKKLRGEFASAENSYRAAGEAAKATGVKTSYSIIMNNLASMEIVQGRLDEAQRDIEQAIAAERQAAGRLDLAIGLNNQVLIDEMRGDFGRAFKAANEQCSINEEIGPPASLAGCRIGLAKLFIETGDKENARAALNKALAVDLKPSSLLGWMWANAAFVRLRLGDIAGAESLVARGQEARRKRDFIAEQDLPLDITAARIDTAKGNAETAIANLTIVRAQAEQAGLKPIALEAGLAIAEAGGRGSAKDVQSAAESAGLKFIANRARLIKR